MFSESNSIRKINYDFPVNYEDAAAKKLVGNRQKTLQITYEEGIYVDIVISAHLIKPSYEFVTIVAYHFDISEIKLSSKHIYR
jgi:hypothetical protein